MPFFDFCCFSRAQSNFSPHPQGRALTKVSERVRPFLKMIIGKKPVSPLNLQHEMIQKIVILRKLTQKSKIAHDRDFFFLRFYRGKMSKKVKKRIKIFFIKKKTHPPDRDFAPLFHPKPGVSKKVVKVRTHIEKLKPAK